MKFRPRRSEPPRVDITPLIDVVFLMLIFFMVSTTFDNNHGLDKFQVVTNRTYNHPASDPNCAPGAFLLLGIIVWVQRWISGYKEDH